LGRRRTRIVYGWKSQRGKDHWKDQDIGGWMILRWMLVRQDWGGFDWIGLAEDGDKWRAPVNVVMNHQIL
jgi:hypothetical protein